MTEHDPAAARNRAYWRANLRLLTALLAIWAATAFLLSIVLVEPLNEVRIGGFPLGFWFAQQGSIYVFIVLILVYAVAMDRLERRLLAADEGDGPPARDGDGDGGANPPRGPDAEGRE